MAVLIVVVPSFVAFGCHFLEMLLSEKLSFFPFPDQLPKHALQSLWLASTSISVLFVCPVAVLGRHFQHSAEVRVTVETFVV